MIQIKRAYEAPTEQDGYRVLVDRVWPRGKSKESEKLDEWLKEVAQVQSYGNGLIMKQINILSLNKNTKKN